MGAECLWRAGPLLGGVLFTVVFFILAAIYGRFPGDEAVLLALQGLRTPGLDRLVFGITALGNVAVALPVMCGTFLALLWVHRRPDAVAVAACSVPIALGHGLKMVVGRPRPEYAISDVAYTGMSFPSGHALFALLFGSLLIVLAEQMIRPLAIRRGVQAAVALLALAMGTSRVYLGVHWPSDVIGGYLVAAISLVIILALRDKLASKGW